MSDGRKTKFKEPMQDIDLPKMKLEVESEAKPETPLTAEQIYLKRQAEVAQQDNEDFSEYLREKASRDQQQAPQPAPVPPPAAAPQTAPRRLNRRSLLTWAAGTAAVGEAVTLGYPLVTGQSIPDQGLRHGGATYAEAQRHPIDRELVNPQADVGGRRFGDWVLLMPTKLGGGTYAVNLNTGRALAWISYWNYGDYNPISHHLCTFPSADPAKGFEWINSTQGGKNSLIYGIPTQIETPGEGFNIYRVRYDGSQMEVMENVAETTGLGLGVHVNSKIYPDPKTGKYDYLGTKGQKIEWEMVPMGELFVEEGTLPGDDVLSLCGADGTIWHPSGRWASTIVRLCGGQLILDAEKNFEPVTFLQFNKNAPNQYPVKKIDNDHWEVTFDKIFSPGHEIGFSPDGRFLCMMNNLRENNCSVFDSSDPDPRNWKKIAHIEDPLWVGKYPNPFHMVFSMDGSKLYLSILHPSPATSGVMVVDTKTWKIKKEIQGIGPDMQTLAVTYDGKYVVGVFSGFQRLSSGIAFIDAETDELVGIWPSNGGHHDCVIVPRTLEHMKHTRSCTL